MLLLLPAVPLFVILYLRMQRAAKATCRELRHLGLRRRGRDRAGGVFRSPFLIGLTIR
jgi:hypothetical protein